MLGSFPSDEQRRRAVAINGRKHDSHESAARVYGISRNTLDYRLSRGWTPEQAVGIEPRPNHAKRTPGIPVKVQGHDFRNIKEAARYYGRSYTYIFERLKKGQSIEEALGLISRMDSLLCANPELARQWHPMKNAPLTADQVTSGSGRKVWWRCPHGHEWRAVINSRNRGCGCPLCAGQKPSAAHNLAAEYPELAGEWDWGRNGDKKPEDCTPRSSSRVWWKCKKEHSWQATISNRTRSWKSVCPFCSNVRLCDDNSLAKVFPDIAQDWHSHKNAPLTPKDVLSGGGMRVWWKCKHGHEWRASIGSRVISGTGCPLCCNQTSRMEICVYAELVALFERVEWRARISGHECDIYLRDCNIGVEIDGVYWHRQKLERDIAKAEAFDAAGIKLFRLREYDLPLLSERDIAFKTSDAREVVISRLVSALLEKAELADQQRVLLRDYINGPGLINETLSRIEHDASRADSDLYSARDAPAAANAQEPAPVNTARPAAERGRALKDWRKSLRSL